MSLNKNAFSKSTVQVGPKLSTTKIPVNQTQGTSSDCSTVFVGDFSNMFIGMLEDIKIIRLDQTFAKNGQVGFWCRMRADVGFARPEAFTKLIGVRA